MKPQSIRLVDVFVIGPVMIWAGYKLAEAHPLRGQFLIASGIGTIAYNGRNYLLREEGKLPAET